MAQGQAALAHPHGIAATASASEKDLHDLRQYDSIVQFRDAILAGRHPTIKPPPGLPATTPSPPRPTDLGQSSPAQQANTHNQHSLPITASAKHTYGSGNTEINPILLEKSDELVRAEFRLQRQRLEREIKEDVDQRRGSKPEKVADVDLSDVLAKALTLVQATAVPGATDENLTTNEEIASDSFDDNTFYSSRHDTPESPLTSRVRNESEEARQPNAPLSSSNIPSPNRNHVPQVPPDQQGTSSQVSQGYLGTNATASTSGQFQVPGLNNYANGEALSGQTSQANTSGEQSQSDDSANVNTAYGSQARNAHEHLDDAYVETHPPSPLLRTHDIPPAAPQPIAAPPFPVEEQLASAVDQGPGAVRGAPAQVAALRNEPIAVTSPESSPHSGKGPEKKKGKKKKRKADRQAPEDVMPYIKPEPRSASPVNAPRYIRPNKRQRQSHRQANDLDRDDLTIANGPQQHNASPAYQGGPVAVGYGSTGGYPQRAASTAVIGDPRYGREDVNDRRLPEGTYIRRQPSPHRFIQRPPSGAYATRPVSQVVVDDGYRETPRDAYREPYEATRMSVRPDADPYVGQPVLPPPRIYVDSFGREYIEPPRPAPRQSVAPAPSHSGPEVIYERPPARAVSRHPGPAYDDNRGAAYSRAPSMYPAPRRVVTQPEYVPQDFRDGRPAEYSVRPTAPPTEYVQVMPPPERQTGPDGSQQYGSRAASVRPAEPVRYEVPHEYGRVPSLRPEAAAADYTGGVQHEGRREVAKPYVMDYGPRPVEQPVYHRGYSVRPAEQYYNQPPGRGGDEIAFIERPRGATQEIVYADDARREIYR